MTSLVKISGLSIEPALFVFIRDEVLQGLAINESQFWDGAAKIIKDLSPINAALLAHRQVLQVKIDDWHQSHRQQGFDAAAYQQFLRDIDYILPEGDDFNITTKNTDPEIALTAGPQLVVPLNNARYALNAANARWGSLYAALYGTDAIAFETGLAPKKRDGARRAKVVAFGRTFLDEHFPLANGSYRDATGLSIEQGCLQVESGSRSRTGLVTRAQFKGYVGSANQPSIVLLRHNGLHVELVVDRDHPTGKDDPAGIADIQIEAALSTIMDCEDSVAAVDVDDKITVYRNWLGLMKGDLSATMVKADQPTTRTLNGDRTYQGTDGEKLILAGRAMMLVRNVGHLMRSDMVRDENGEPVFEGLLDGLFTSLIALHDVRGTGALKNSRAGSIYIVKPKMHGPEEVAFTVQLFSRIEQLFGLAPHTLKLGLMDEERRTTLNLKECIRAAKHRLFFINTGFLDRTGDEIHTSMEAGPMRRKGDMKNTAWILAYEVWNVQVGLACGLPGRGQIGKGMWAMPDLMHDLLAQKIAHLEAGANTAWVPSPTAAVLHALHYHQLLVADRQLQLVGQTRLTLDELLQIPVTPRPEWSKGEVQRELDNNAQGILGYVVRWIEDGIGCSKVPDIDHIGLMEDRATLRISSQHIANWLRWGICTNQQVLSTMQRMAKVVDQQNGEDPGYQPMCGRLDESLAFQAACDLVFLGTQQSSGYTEPILHAYRLAAKARSSGDFLGICASKT